MSDAFSLAVRKVFEVMVFENWLRFYFISEEQGALMLRLPQEAEKKIKEHYPAFEGLLAELQDQEITHERSINAICMFIAAQQDLEKSGIPSESIFDSMAFQVEMQLFGSWVQSHEEQLDTTFMDLRTWLKLYDEWKKTPKVQEYIAQIQNQEQRVVKNCDTVQ
ncbi:hypothetical protein [Desulfovibrio litoralis]|uniref:Uncharacterized protein n=1 Tax=Desulfovibrio litoralis DSM 11393 TaxID=1121455 RepID=A0A1M7RWE4_9BACT|nr:hypothetical protein [Desulfovibrio litoralis]SHN50448.1 hypothetical protein SAMN02745728_00246 [Desulfovibrio litoralis DSM 11393]